MSRPVSPICREDTRTTGQVQHAGSVNVDIDGGARRKHLLGGENGVNLNSLAVTGQLGEGIGQRRPELAPEGRETLEVDLLLVR